MAADEAVDELRGDRAQDKRIAFALDRQLGSGRKLHLFTQLGRYDELPFGANLSAAACAGLSSVASR